MNLKTKYSIVGLGYIEVNTECKLDITSKVKITSKHKQSAINKAQQMEQTFANTIYIHDRVQAIDKKIDKKKAFFAKHKQ